MNKKDLSLSIVIPVYNEEKRLQKTFSALLDFTRKELFKNVEVIFVDDGSSDNTLNLTKNFNLPNSIVKVVSYKPNMGKGRAVSEGMINSSLDYSLICDADISTSFNEIIKFIPLMETGSDIIIGTRKSDKAVIIKSQGFWRRNLGKCYTIIANIITGLSVSDFTCGFKFFSKNSRDKIFKKVKINRWSYDAEILFLANKFGYKINEVPIAWENDDNSSVRLYKDIVRSFIDLLVIRFSKY